MAFSNSHNEIILIHILNENCSFFHWFKTLSMVYLKSIWAHLTRCESHFNFQVRTHQILFCQISFSNRRVLGQDLSVAPGPSLNNINVKEENYTGVILALPKLITALSEGSGKINPYMELIFNLGNAKMNSQIKRTS